MLKYLSLLPKLFIAPDQTKLTPWAYFFLVVLCMATFIPGLVSLPPTDRDESLFAQATKQMIETGNYVDIKFQNEPRYKKPIGIYWLQALAVTVFDKEHINEIWAYRIPSVLGATLSVLLTAALGGTLFGPVVGFLGALMMASCFLLNFEARLAKTDAMLLATVMGAQFALANAYFKNKRSIPNVLLFWTTLGIGILIKGPIILLVLISTVCWLKWRDRTLGWMNNLSPAYGIPYLFLLVCPWFLAIILQSHGDFIAQSAGHDLLAKIWKGQDRGIMPPGMHALLFPIIFFPSSLFALLAIPDTWANRYHKPISFCLGWLVPTWLVFELSLTKLPHYVLPTYPVIALLAAKALVDGYPVLCKPEGRKVFISLVVGGWLIIGLAFAMGFGLFPLILNEATPSRIMLMMGLIFVLLQAVTLLLLFHHPVEAVSVVCLASVLFIGCLFGINLPERSSLWLSETLYKEAQSLAPCVSTPLIASTYHEPSLVFLAGTSTLLFNNGIILADHLKQNPCLVVAIDDEHKKQFLDAFNNNPLQPTERTTIDGINMARESKAHLTLYTLSPMTRSP